MTINVDLLSAVGIKVYSRMRESWVYIVASESRTLYIGVTTELEQRTWQHKTKRLEGFSALHNCDRLVYFEEFFDITEAISREKQLKGWSRAKKLAIIRRENPGFDDLAADWFEPQDIVAELTENAAERSSKTDGPKAPAAKNLD